MGAAQQAILAYGVTAAVGTEFVTSFALPGTILNNFTGEIGFKFTVGASPITISALGRWVVSGNSATHAMRITASDGITTITGATATIPTSGAPAAAFNYVNLGSPVTLSALTVYYLFSAETTSGDQWYNSDSFVTTTLVAAITGAAYNDAGSVGFLTNPNSTYGPVSFKY